MHSTKADNVKHQVQLLRQQFAQSGCDPITQALGSGEIELILAQEVGAFRERVYPPMVTLHLFIDQVLCMDHACQDAVGRRLSQRVADAQKPCSLNTGPYCKARARLSVRLPQRLCKDLGVRLERCAAPRWGWHGRSVKLFDGTSVSMPDTPKNQKMWPQNKRQKPCLGFPVARIGALISLSSGAVIDYAVAPMQGKSSGEQALLREVAVSLCRGDILLADALHSSWWALNMLMQQGVDAVMPNDGKRRVDFAQGQALSKIDHVVWWPKPKRATWIKQADYAKMPAGIWVREVRVHNQTIVTTLTDPAQISCEELAAFYAQRWNIEVDFRTLKETINMDVLRCMSPAMVSKEIAVYLLAYNLVRWAMVRAANLAQVPARALSFSSARRLICNFAGHLRRCTYQDTDYLVATLLKSIAHCKLPRRPNRIEPRAKKRRPKPLPLLTVPRHVARENIRVQRLKVVP
jgi:hypothetical protein